MHLPLKPRATIVALGSARSAAALTAVAIGLSACDARDDASDSSSHHEVSAPDDSRFVGLDELPLLSVPNHVPELVDSNGTRATPVHTNWPWLGDEAEPATHLDQWPRLSTREEQRLDSEYAVVAATVLVSDDVGADGIPVESNQEVHTCWFVGEASNEQPSDSPCEVLNHTDHVDLRLGPDVRDGRYVVAQFEWFALADEQAEDMQSVSISYAFTGSSR